MIDNDGVRSTEAPDCPFCGGRGEMLHEGLRDRYFGAPGRWSYLRCYACGHVWLQPRPEPSEVAKLYPSYWDDYGAAFGQPMRSADAAPGSAYHTGRAMLVALGYRSAMRSRRDVWLGKMLLAAAPLREIAEGEVLSLHGPARGRLLDVGCGDGAFLAQMRSLGWEVEGLESDPAAVRIARTRRGLAVTEATIGGARLPEESYDAITMSHVIEHLWEPVQDLASVSAWLKPAGTLVLRTPNVDSLGHRRFQEDWMPLEPPRHIHLFTTRTLRVCVERAGLRVVDLHTSARIAQGIFDSSRAIQDPGQPAVNGRIRHRSLRARIFIVEEMLACLAGGEVGEEIVLLGTRDAR